jgi:hypothetical protein
VGLFALYSFEDFRHLRVVPEDFDLEPDWNLVQLHQRAVRHATVDFAGSARAPGVLSVAAKGLTRWGAWAGGPIETSPESLQYAA